MHTNPSRDNLTQNQRYVLNLLLQEKSALTAYTILDRLRAYGFRAPLQVYRALEKLIAAGLVHRLESVNAFIACSHSDCGGHSLAAFAICQKCGTVIEFDDTAIAKNVTNHMKTLSFQPSATTLEIQGICAPCQKR